MKHIPLPCPPDGHFSPLLWSRALLVASFAASTPLALAAPVAMTGAGSYTQNFDTLSITGTSNAWVDDTTIAGWYSQRTGTGTTYTADAGSGTAGTLYSYGTAASTERALGTIGSGNAAAGSFAHGVQLQNTSGGSLTLNSIAYTGEEWRKSGVTVAQVVTLWYKVSSTAITALTPSSNTGWTAISAGDFSSPNNTTTAGALDGNAAANRTVIPSFDPNISVPDGNFVMIRWMDPDHSGTDHGLAIDDVAIAWSVSALPPITVSASPLTTFAENAGAAVTTGTVSIPTALGSDLVVTLASSDTTEATVPVTVTILAGSTTANFAINAVNDFLADGAQSANVTASAIGYLTGQLVLTVEDDSDAPINVSVIPSSFAENAGAAASTGTITIAENTVADLTVNLSSGDTTEATVPATATILAGTNSITFPVDAVNDTEVDGTRNVTIFATATGYTNGNVQIQVLDDGDTPPAPTLPVHGIAFTGYNADGNDNLAFVALVPIAAGDVILFSDNEWNGSAVGSGGGFVDTNEGILTWTAPAGGVAEGTIVTLDNLDQVTRSASAGTLTGSNFALAAGGDSVYAFQGALLAPTRVLAAISANTDIITGTGLTDYVLLATGVDIGAYKGSRSNQPTYAGYLTQIHDEVANWVTQDTGANDGIDTVAPDVPFSSTAFTLAAANSYASWIAGYPAVGAFTGPNDDFDGDGLDNAIENILGSDPSVGNVGLTTVSGTSSSVTFRHSRADSPATDLTASYEWSTDLTTWYPSGAGGGVTVTIGAPTVITDGSPNDIVEVTATVTSGTATSLFVHLKATNP